MGGSIWARKNYIEDPNIRFVNIKALLLSYYSLFPPLTNEALKFNLVQSHEEAWKMITLSILTILLIFWSI